MADRDRYGTPLVPRSEEDWELIVAQINHAIWWLAVSARAVDLYGGGPFYRPVPFA